jgi:hypothetical protein
MATLVFQAAGAALGSLFGPVGTIIGRAAGGLAGAALDRSLLGGSATGAAKLRDLDVTASTEGTSISRVWGRARVAGQIIWATRLDTVTAKRAAGGKGIGGGQTTETTSYFANVALGLCEGRVARVGRVWADGKLLDLTRVTMRIHTGGEEQQPDPLIIAKEGRGNAPAYRGLAYVVFERLPLEAFGNRVPQLAFEVIRPVGRLEREMRSVCLIPGSTEFGYDTRPVARMLGLGASASENRHTSTAATDFEASLDELEALCPNLEHVSLVVAWFGDDLRCGSCTVTPRVDEKTKRTTGAEWTVAGLTRGAARPVSRYGDRAAYGGTPSDAGVIRAIQSIKARGLKVTLYPFLMMDIPAGNTLPHPTSGAASQGAYPWRGEIAAAGGGTGAAGGEVAGFFGAASAAHYAVSNGAVGYTGPVEWGWRRFVLHLAALGKAAGGVDAVIIGSEFRDLTRSRDGAASYPAVGQLMALAGEVRALVGAGTRITYAADWTEYGAHVLDGGSEVRFPLDPLWAHPALDAVGIDFYAPLADWRPGVGHRDGLVSDSIYDPGYLASNVAGGEDHAWYYASPDDRAAQVRTPITDGGGKPWTFRAKDLAGWWGNAHHERVGGVELSAPTAWVAGVKPIWLTEIGCPAVDKGANAPNLFPDAKSTAANLPPFSTGARDDLMQRRALEAVLDVYAAGAPGNPASAVYGGPMVDASRTSAWAWDARPFPVFPTALDVWADGAAHATGHWLTGRLGQAPLAELAAAILVDAGAAAFDTTALEGVIDGYVIDRPASAREALEPLADVFGFGAVEREGRIVLKPRGRGAVRLAGNDDLVVEKDGAEPSFARGQETELPVEIAIGFADVLGDFRPAVAAARRRGTAARGMIALDTAIIGGGADLRGRAEIRLQDLWVGRDTASFVLPPSDIGLEPGDLVALKAAAGGVFEVQEIADGPTRRVSARAIAPEIFAAPRGRDDAVRPKQPALPGPPEVVLLDLPAPDGEPPVLTRIALAARPWPGAVTVWRDNGGTFEPHLRMSAPAIIGETLDALDAGPPWRFDDVGAVTVRISSGELIAASDERLFAGVNAAALQNPAGSWEIIQFGRAELVADRTYRLSHLLRGQSGSEPEAAVGKPAGSRFVLLDAAVLPLVRGVDQLGRPGVWRVAAANRDHADPFAVELGATPSGRALEPWAPVHLRARRTPGGIALSWTRRTRIGGDAWDVAEVPLGEEREAYRVEILDGSRVVRAIEVAASEYLYSTHGEVADFGSIQSRLAVQVRQMSATVGPGSAVQGDLDV